MYCGNMKLGRPLLKNEHIPFNGMDHILTCDGPRQQFCTFTVFFQVLRALEIAWIACACQKGSDCTKIWMHELFCLKLLGSSRVT